MKNVTGKLNSALFAHRELLYFKNTGLLIYRIFEFVKSKRNVIETI